ncbi:MAG: alanine racemase, partial [Bacteroidales bacterium]|nr:alanine racemase [Bacteroidales bacterium]
KKHKIIIMIEMGELREGVMREGFMDFYARVFELPNIEVVGIGTNLSCLYGVLPNQDKLIQLSLYEQLIEAKFNKNIPFVSGGSSVTIPLIFNGLLPFGINHFRVGETLFFGNDIYNNQPIKEMKQDVFRFYAEIIELAEKPVVPVGEMGTNVEGDEVEFDETDYSKTACRALIDLGLLDVDKNHITPVDQKIEIAGASSDMFVVDIGDNKKGYKVGDLLEFKLDYMGALGILNSRYVEKKAV